MNGTSSYRRAPIDAESAAPPPALVSVADTRVARSMHLAVPNILLSIDEVLGSICESLSKKKRFQHFCDTVLPHLPRLFTVSPFAQELCLREPSLLLESDLLAKATRTNDGAIDRLWCQLEDAPEEALFMSQLRHLRNAQMLGIIWRDLIIGQPVCETLEDLSYLADRCIELVYAYSHIALTARFGEARDTTGHVQRLIVLAMGKLGGRELNFSSDVDLILVYPRAGNTDGKRQLDNGEFFKKQTQMMVRLLSKITQDGFVFRVDLRLRPFGESGALVINFEAVEHYYLNQGREWERYAMVKARALCGNEKDQSELMQMLRPFVYRRYLDYSAISSLRDLKAQIVAEVANKGMHNNIKLGLGGIREIEFIAQAFQLVRGGREPALQKRSILRVLKEVAVLGLLLDDEVSALTEAYCFLRRTENSLQMVNDQQTHTLPQAENEKLRLAYAMGYSGWNPFRQDLDRQLSVVQTCFQSLFQFEAPSSDDGGLLSRLSVTLVQNKTDLQTHFEQRGIEKPTETLNALEDLLCGAFFRNLSGAVFICKFYPIHLPLLSFWPAYSVAVAGSRNS